MNYTVQLTQEELDIIRVSLDGTLDYYDGALKAAKDVRADEVEYFGNALKTAQALVERLAEMDNTNTKEA